MERIEEGYWVNQTEVSLRLTLLNFWLIPSTCRSFFLLLNECFRGEMFRRILRLEFLRRIITRKILLLAFSYFSFLNDLAFNILWNVIRPQIDARVKEWMRRVTKWKKGRRSEKSFDIWKVRLRWCDLVWNIIQWDKMVLPSFPFLYRPFIQNNQWGGIEEKNW